MLLGGLAFLESWRIDQARRKSLLSYILLKEIRQGVLRKKEEIGQLRRFYL